MSYDNRIVYPQENESQIIIKLETSSNKRLSNEVKHYELILEYFDRLLWTLLMREVNLRGT